jgi:hypothetical protein
LFPFYDYGSRPDTVRRDYATRDESLQTHGVNRPSCKEVGKKSRAYRASFTFSTFRHRESKLRKLFARFQPPLILASFGVDLDIFANSRPSRPHE